MRYRKRDNEGDYVFGGQTADFLTDSPEAVAQAVQTRLTLLRGEWFLDTSAGMPWSTEVLGKYTGGAYDAAIRQCILGTQGAAALADYTSTLDTEQRRLTVSATLDTLYGPTQIQVTL